MKTKRFLATVLCGMLLLALLPTTAFAAGTGAIQLGADGIAKDNKVYFGQKGTVVVPWIAIDDNGFLLSEYTIGATKFRDEGDRGYYNYSTNRNAEDSSKLKTVMDGLYNGSGTKLFTDLEQGAVMKTSLTGDSMSNDSTPAVDAYLFPLSYTEATSIDGVLWQAKSIDAPDRSTDWWFRYSSDPEGVFFMNVFGQTRIIDISGSCGVRPAFNLKLNSVLFISAAVGGKSTAGMNSGLTAVSSATPSEWKLTLKDSSRSFAVTDTAFTGTNAFVTYSGAATGENEYISAIVKDENGNITRYGRLKNTTAAADASGMVNIDLSGMTLAATDTLYVFSEQYNGGAGDNTKLTDYASDLVAVPTDNTNAYSVTNSLTNISSNGLPFAVTSEDYTATLAADTNYTLPASITVKVGASTLAAGTDYTYDSTNGELTIYAASITGDIEITAAGIAPPMTYALTVYLDGGNGGTTGGDYAENDRINISAGTKANYSFNGWTSSNGGTFDNANSASTTFTMPGNATTITANWTPDPIQYQITEGQNGEWTQGSAGGLRFTANADYDKFRSVLVDNSVLPSDQYTVQSGSTIVTLKASYLSALSVGQHTLRVNFTDGYAQTTFTVNGYIDLPKTGDSATPALWLGILLMAGAVLTASLVIRRRRQNG